VIQALVFDFDGVLADSEPLHLRAFQETFAPLGITVTRDEYYAHYLGYSDEDAIVRLAARHHLATGDRQVRALLDQKKQVFDEMLLGTDVLHPGAAECVERLARDYPLGIASGALRDEIEAILRRHRLDGHFQFIVAAGDTPASKPAPDPYARAAALHGRQPAECLAIEDSRWGLESARTAGLTCIGITHSYPAQDLPGAHAIIDSLDELTPVFIRRLDEAAASAAENGGGAPARGQF
jgi:beta-phosphoglucomutase